MTSTTFTGLAARPAIKEAGDLQRVAQQSLGTAEAITTHLHKTSPVDFESMKPGTFVIIVASRLNPHVIGARVDRISPASDMIYLTDAVGNDRVCFADELQPTEATFDIQGAAKQGQSQNRPMHSAVDYKAAAAKRKAHREALDPRLITLLEASKRIGVPKALLSRAAKLGDMTVTRSETGRALGVMEQEAARWARERNRKPGPKRPNGSSSPATVGEPKGDR